MDIEKLQLEDSRICLVRQILLDSEGVSTQSLDNNDMRAEPSSVFIVTVNNVIIGVAELHPIDNETLTLINFVSVNKGMGYGRLFLREIEYIHTELGYKYLCLTSTPHAAAFYTKQGYSSSGSCELGFIKSL
jgi:N-acetylglutamate synthase-like GNAT family acetyltransferase